MAKIDKLFSKVVMIVFLVLLVLGFVVPGILNNTSDSAATEQRMCSSDADCSLICDQEPLIVLCLQNLCAQNSCTEKSYFQYNQEAISFTLQIENLILESRSNDKDIFVKFNGNEVHVFTSKLPLYYILEKANLIFDTQCLTFDGNQHCSSELLMTVNENNSTVFGNYVPQQDDVININYQ